MGLKDLFKPAWQSENADRAIRGVKRLKNQAQLAEIAKGGYKTFENVRVTAMQQLKDEQFIFEVAKYIINNWWFPNGVMIECALSKMENIEKKLLIQKTLTDRLTETPNRELKQDSRNCNSLISYIDDQELLLLVAHKAPLGENRLVAAKKLANPSSRQNTLKEIVLQRGLNDKIGKDAYSLLNGSIRPQVYQELQNMESQKQRNLEIKQQNEKIEFEKAERKKNEDNQLRIFQLLTKEHRVSSSGKLYITSMDLDNFNDKTLIYKMAMESEKIYYYEAHMTNNSTDWYQCPERVAKICLPKLDEKERLREIAQSALIKEFRWMACVLSGGHFYDTQKKNKCKCTICEHQSHEMDRIPGKICGKCGAELFRSNYEDFVRFPDGTEEPYFFDNLAYLESKDKQSWF